MAKKPNQPSVPTPRRPEPPFPGIILREMAPADSAGAVVKLHVELDDQARVCRFAFEALNETLAPDAARAAMRVGILAVEDQRRGY